MRPFFLIPIVVASLKCIVSGESCLLGWGSVDSLAESDLRAPSFEGDGSLRRRG